MEMNRMIAMFMEYCKSKQLRERTMLSYEQSLKLFAVWLEDVEEITHVEKIKEMNIRRYPLESCSNYSALWPHRSNWQQECVHSVG